jgi:hypothetical protein
MLLRRSWVPALAPLVFPVALDAGPGRAVAGALLQNGQTYSPTFRISGGSSRVALGGTFLTAARFSIWDDASAHPVLSATGDQIQFGFVSANDNTNWTASRAAGFDNWPVTVNQSETFPVPEPSAPLLPGSGLAGMIEAGAQAAAPGEEAAWQLGATRAGAERDSIVIVR